MKNLFFVTLLTCLIAARAYDVSTSSCPTSVLTTYTSSSGTITLMSNQYVHNMDCYWHIQPAVAAGLSIAIIVNSFSTEAGYDFLTIHNGTSSDAPVVVALSGTSTGTFICTAGSCTLHFHSDAYVEAAGFSVSYAVAGPMPVVTAVSPAFALAGQTPTLSVTGSNFRAGATVRVGSGVCTGVYVASNGQSLTCTAPSSTGAGAQAVSVTVSNTDGVSATLREAYAVWEASTSLCPASSRQVLTTSQGTLTLGTYSDMMDCYWHISVPHAAGQVVSFAITSVSTEPCCDYVRVHNGSSSMAPIVLSALGATAPTDAAACSASVCTVHFHSDQSVVGAGFTLNWALSGAAPVVSAVTPASASEYTATQLRVSGSNIRAGASVRVGNRTCSTTLVDVAAQSVTCTLADTLPAGVYTVVILNADYSQGALAGAFTAVAAPPTVTSISPATGASMRSVYVTVSGTHFRSGATVTVGGFACTSPYVSAGGRTISCTTSSSLGAGDFTVVVRNSDGSLASLLNAFSTYESSTTNCPSSVNGALTAQYGTITLSSSQYTNNMQCVWRIQPAGVAPNTLIVISIDALDTESCCDPLSVYNGTSTSSPVILSVAGAHLPDPVRCRASACTVKFTSDTSVTGSGFALHYAVVGPAPTLSSVSPSTAYEMRATNMTLTGTNLRTGASVRIGTSRCGNVVVASNGQSLTCVSANDTVAGTYDVTVTNPDAASATRTNAITLRQRPHIDSVSPMGYGHHLSTTLAISGTHFSSPSITVGGLACSPAWGTSTMMQCNTPSLAMGVYDVVIRNSDGSTDTLPSAFYSWDVNTGNCPFSVGSVKTDISGTITVSASEYANGLDCYWHISPARESIESVRFKVNSIDTESCCDYITFHNGPDSRSTGLLTARGSDAGSQITCTASVCTIHFHTDGSVTDSGFEVAWNLVGSSPQVDSISPDHVSESTGSASVYIYASYIRQGASVTIGEQTCTVLYMGSSYINCQTSGALSVGVYDVVVTNPNGRMGTLERGFAVQGASPSISLVDPDTLYPYDSSVMLTIHGTNFREHATVTVGDLSDHYNCTGVYRYTQNEITCTLPGSQMGEGYYDVTVRNEDQTSARYSNAIHVTYGDDEGWIAAVIIPVVVIFAAAVLACVGCVVHHRHQKRVVEWRKKNAASEQRARTGAVQAATTSSPSSSSPIVVSASTSSASASTPPPMFIRMSSSSYMGGVPQATPILGVTDLAQRQFTVSQPPPAALYPTFVGDSARALDQPAAIPSSFSVTVGPEAYMQQQGDSSAPVPMVPSEVAELKALTYTPPQPQPYWATDMAAPPPYYVTLPTDSTPASPPPMVVMQAPSPQMQMEFMSPPVMYAPGQQMYSSNQSPMYAPAPAPMPVYTNAPSPRPATAAAAAPQAAARKGQTRMVNATSPRPATANGGQMMWMMPAPLQPAMRTNNQEQHQQEMFAMMQSAPAPSSSNGAPASNGQESMVPAYVMTAQGPMLVMMPRPAQSQLTL